MSTHIVDFWKKNRSFWITPPSKQKVVDKYISDSFWNYPIHDETMLGKVIYFDQFYRHFCRHGLVTEEDVTKHRVTATELVKDNVHMLKEIDSVEIIFAMMPFKHLKDYDFIFETLHTGWLPSHSGSVSSESLDFQKFYADTYKKAFTLDTVRANLITEHELTPYDASLICESYPDKYTSKEWSIKSLEGNKLLPYLKPDRNVLVSLSGGVDSMVMLTLLKYNKVSVSAVHIVYGNRAESKHEYSMLAEFCSKLGVPLFVYKVRWLRRGHCDRKFYEDMTRELRFNAYHAAAFAVASPEPCVLMGHIKDDVIENVWTNIAHCHHLGNLKKMEAEEVQFGVRILRPLLMADKSDIYTISELIGIPYFKNTTPSWSNRGKFRDHFHKATLAQFGESIDAKLIEFAEAIQTQHNLLNQLLYDPIYQSFNQNTVIITTAIRAKLDANSWVGIFEHICHTFLGCSRPSIKCVRDFTNRLYRPWTTLNVEMGKDFKVHITKSADGQTTMECIVLTK